MIIGAHVSAAGGLKQVLARATAIEIEAIQIFPSAPVQWRIKGFPDDEIALFKESWPLRFKEVVFHGIYLTNLASDSSEIRAKTVTALIDTLKLAARLGITKTIFHAGSYDENGLIRRPEVARSLKEIFDQTPPETILLYENTAGSTIGGRLDDLAWLLEVSPRDRAGVCLDSCHTFAAGYDLRTIEQYQEFIRRVDETVGLENVQAWHLNDSKFGLGERRDRHQNIGQGQLGIDPFSFLVNDRRWESVCGYLEVPGFDENGPDLKNVEIIKRLRK